MKQKTTKLIALLSLSMLFTSVSAQEKKMPVPARIISISPIILSAPRRDEDSQLRVSAPATGKQLPISVFAHGYGSSSDGYAPFVNFWDTTDGLGLPPKYPLLQIQLSN